LSANIHFFILARLLDRHTFAGFPVVLSKDKRRVIGYITRADLYTALELAVDQGMHKGTLVFLANSLKLSSTPVAFVDISSYVDLYPTVVSPDTPLDILLDIFKGIGLRCAMVANEDDMLIGLIKKKDIAEFISTSVVANEFISKSRHSRLNLYQSINNSESNASFRPLIDEKVGN
jgi:CBS domain-containing protein